MFACGVEYILFLRCMSLRGWPGVKHQVSINSSFFMILWFGRVTLNSPTQCISSRKLQGAFFVCSKVCVSFRCQPYLRNQWSNSYHIWHGDCLSHETVSHILLDLLPRWLLLDVHVSGSHERRRLWTLSEVVQQYARIRRWESPEWGSGAEDMLTFVSFTLSAFFKSPSWPSGYIVFVLSRKLPGLKSGINPFFLVKNK